MGESMNFFIFLMSALILGQSSNLFAMGGQRPDLEVVNSVDFNQYVGKWYEIGRLPQSFEKGCVGVTAEYQLRTDNKVNVINTCRKSSCEGRVSTANGLARVVDPKSNAKLKVSFFWPFEGDYWILELDPKYAYAVVGSPDRKSFWILSRNPSLSKSLKEDILARFVSKGFNFETLETTQTCE